MKNIKLILLTGSKKRNGIVEQFQKQVTECGIEVIVIYDALSKDIVKLLQKHKALKCLIIGAESASSGLKVIVKGNYKADLQGSIISTHGTDIKVSTNNPYYPKEKLIFMEDWKKVILEKYSAYCSYSFFNKASLEELVEMIKDETK